jgi:hypothetical protein
MADGAESGLGFFTDGLTGATADFTGSVSDFMSSAVGFTKSPLDLAGWLTMGVGCRATGIVRIVGEDPHPGSNRQENGKPARNNPATRLAMDVFMCVPFIFTS